MWLEVCCSSVVSQRTENIFAVFFLLSLSSVTKGIAVTIAALCSSKNKLSKQLGIQQVFCYGFLKTKNTTWMPRDRDLQEWPCVLRHLEWRWQGAGWGSACGTRRQPLSPALLEAGGKEAGAGRTSATKGCEALQSSPHLSA